MERANYYFKVPFTKEGKEKAKQVDNNLHIVGIIDASGSMSSWWKWIAEFYNTALPTDSLYTLTFDHRVKDCPGNKLSHSIFQHGGGRTAIPEVFQEFERHLKTVPKHKNITVLFISDGQDNSLSTLEQRMNNLKGNTENRNINFICLGIKSGFPTFLSMQLRKLYHRGDAIPALYLVEYVSEKAFFNKFEGIKKYFYSSSTVKLDPAVNLFPWEETVVDEAYEGGWVITQSQEIIVDGVKYPVVDQSGKQQQLNVEQAVDLFRGWVQQLQITSLTDMKEATECAKIAYSEMEYIVKSMSEKMGLNVLMKLEEQNTQKGDSLCLRSKKNYIIRYGGKLQWFLDEIQQLSQGKSPKFENEFEAAKRMNIGTITGKYQQKVLSLKNLTVNKFKQMVDEFMTVYNSLKLEERKNMSSVKRIFLEKDFKEGMSYITNQFDFTEMFELEGLGFKLKRTDKTQENIYDCEGRSSVKQNIDLPTLIDKDYLIESIGTNKLLFSLVERQHQDENLFREELNSLVPLFSRESDGDIVHLLNTDLMKFLMSFLVTLNADIMFEDAYEILIGQFLTVVLHPFNNEIMKNEQQDYLQRCFESLDLFYGKNKQFQDRKEMMLNDPQAYFQKYGNEHHILKNFVMVFYATRAGNLQNDEALKLYELLQINFFQRLLQKNGNDINNLIKPEITEQQKQQILEFFQNNVQDYFSLSSFRKDISVQTQRILRESNSDATIPKKFLYNNDQNQISLTVIENYGRQILGQEVVQEKYTAFVKHVNDYNNCYERQVNKDISSVKNFIINKLNADNIKFIPGFSVLFKDLEQLYSQYFLQTHWSIKPLKKEEIQKLAKERDIDFNKLQFSVSGLLKNACCSQKCSFFLKPNEELDKHLAGWKGKIPRGFHRFIAARTEMNPKQLFTEARRKWGKNFPHNFDMDEKFVLKYIQETLEAYQKAQNGVKGDQQEDEEMKEEEKQEKEVKIEDYIKQNWEEQYHNPFENKQFMEKKEKKEEIKREIEEWQCLVCTYLNSNRDKKCQVCEQGRRPEIQKQPQKKEVQKQEEPDSQFVKNQEKIPVEIRDKWNNEQRYLKTLIKEDDKGLGFKFDKNLQQFDDRLQYVAGVDISFSQDIENLACSYLTVLKYPSLEIVYEDQQFVYLDQPYVSGFLAFREAQHLLKLFEKLFNTAPQFKPQVVMVDGNGVLHQNGCGLASHLGVLLDIPTIGVGKTTFYVDGLKKQEIQEGYVQNALKKGDYFLMKGQSGRVWGAALRSEENVKNPIFVSVGTKISIETACQLVQLCSKFRIPEPVRQADLISREKIRKMTKDEEQNAVRDNQLVFLTDFVNEMQKGLEFKDNGGGYKKKNNYYNKNKNYRGKRK